MEHNSFDALVCGLTEAERVTMLEKMKGAGAETENLTFEDKFEDDGHLSFEQQIKKESFIFRIFLWLKALFANTTVQTVYNEHKVSAIARHIENLSPDILDSRRNVLLSGFYNKLTELKLCADFFRPFITYAENDENSFLIFLGSVVMSNVESQINAEVDPYSLSLDAGLQPEQRMILLHKLDDILDDITSIDRTKMYEAVRSYEWLKQFTKLPFMRFIGLFSTVVEGNYSCSFGSVESELSSFSKILCNGLKLSEELLEALYLFSKKGSSSSNLENLEETASQGSNFMLNAKAQISMMKMFITTVPLKYVCRVVYAEPSWMPESFAGGEDWFVRYKTNWRRLFEQKWKSWTLDCKKEMLKSSLKRNFGLETFPLLPERPWQKLWGGFTFRYELTAGFLNWYLHEKFPEHEIVLKTVMLEGDFLQKENRSEFTESFNKMIQLSVDFQNLNRMLSSGGEYGTLFSKLKDEHFRSLQAHSKIDSIVRSVEGDVRSIFSNFGDACRILEKCFTGIFMEKTDSRYDSLTNLFRLDGKNNEKFVESLRNARKSIADAFSMLRELESIDSPALIK